ncbi:MAG: indolepyruvate ferredoxin oxidoreductase subunit alpha [Oscillospiraceae bacterium]
MKKLMLGNEAVARGLYEAGCSLVSSYPGTPSTEISETAAKYEEIYCEWAPNEKVAMEVALGASIGGKRSFCAMKHVGLNVAADPLFTSAYTGVGAGMVIAVADDPGMHSSQNEQDSRHYAIASKIPMLEPADSTECIEMTKLAFEISEKFDTPVFIRLCTRISHSQSIVTLNERVLPPQKEYVKDAQKFVMIPAFAKKKHFVVEDRLIDLLNFSEETDIQKVIDNKSKIGIISTGTSYQYALEVMGDSANYLKLAMINPLPINLIKEFAKKCETVYVIEELDDIIETHCKKNGIDVIGKKIFPNIGEFSQNLVAEKFGKEIPTSTKIEEIIPIRPPVMCAGCPHRGLFYTLSKNKITVCGDIGCYTLGASAPLNAMDTTICMGASISSLHGFNKVMGKKGETKTVAVIGDSTFMHSGMTGLANIAYNASNSTVIILDNSITGMTGHQQNPTTGYNIKGDPATKINLENVCKAVGIERVSVVDPYDLKSCEDVILRELAIDEPSVIISRRPCALLKYVKHSAPLTVDADKCKSCKSCMKIGCPAISIKNKKAVIDKTQCVGCGVCKSLCAFDAINSIKA